MHLRLTLPIVLLVGLLLAHIWKGDFTASSPRLQTARNIMVKENTFRCFLDNQVWEVDSLTAEVIRFNQQTTIYLRSSTSPDKLVFVYKGNLAEGAYTLDDPSASFAYITRQDDPCLLTTDEYYQGMLMIEYVDPATRHLTGSFELLAYSDDCRKLVHIRNGRFNLQYHNRDLM